MRQAKLSGIYYHAAPTLLNKQIEDAFLHEKGPGALPVNPTGKKEDHSSGIIVPMYQYDLAAPSAAWAYKALAESEFPDVVIILCQSKSGESGITTEPYETPYGIVRVDQHLARQLIDRGNVKENNPLFDDDEQVESQLPMLQFVLKKNLEGLKILPIMLGPDMQLKELAVDIKEVLLENNKRASLVVPVNFTSYGRSFGYVPFSHDEVKKVYELDQGAIDLIQENKPLDFLKYVDDKVMNINNSIGIVLALLITKPKKVTLEQYYTSADLNNDSSSFVSFASLALR
jgi:AmmeMemoRadiSam system protein B